MVSFIKPSPAFSQFPGGAQRYVTSGEMPAGAGTGDAVKAGSNIWTGTNVYTTGSTVVFSGGAQFGVGGTRVADAIQASGVLLVYAGAFAGTESAAQRYVTSGELSASSGGDAQRAQDNFWTGSQNVFGPSTTVLVSGVAGFGSAGGTRVSAEGAVQTSGVLLAYAPVHAGVVAGATRYVTSGDLSAASTSPAGATGDVQFNSAGSFGGSGALHWQTGGPFTVSGVTIAYGGAYGNATLAGAVRFVTSGELVTVPSGITTLNALTAAGQLLAVDSAGTDFAVTSATATHTLSLPDAGVGARGAMTIGAQTLSGLKSFAGGLVALGATQVSGEMLVYGPVYQGAVGTAAQRYVTSGELSAAGSGTVTSLVVGSNLEIQPSPLTVSGSVALVADPVVASLVVRGGVQASGVTRIYDNVGIGIEPTSRLQVGGPSAVQLYVTETTTPTTVTMAADTGPAGYIGTTTAHDFRLRSGNTDRVTLYANGAIRVSGVLTSVGGAYAGQVVGAQRYVTSGELAGLTASGITTLNTLTASAQSFAVGTTGTDVNIASAISTHTFHFPDASVFARGVVTTGAQTLSGVKTLADNLVARATVQVSGTLIAYAPAYQGAVGTATRYVTSGELSAGAGTMTSLVVGDNLAIQPSPITTSGSIALAPDVALSTLRTSGSVQISGLSLAYAPLHQGSATGATRYVTSGDLTLAIRSLGGQTGTTQTLAVDTVGTDFAVASAGNAHTWSLPSATYFARGVLTTAAQTISGVKSFADAVQASGILTAWAGGYAGPQTSANRYVTSGELSGLSTGTVTSVVTGDNLVQQPTPLTTSGSIAVSPDVSFTTLRVSSNTQVSGVLLAYGNAYAGVATAALRYVTSGELTAAVTSINSQAGPAVTFAAGSAGTDFAVSAAGNTVTHDLPSATYFARGLLTTAAQTISGTKAFADTVQVSGILTAWAGAYAGPEISANRYITSGELRPDTDTGVLNTASVYWTGAEHVFSAGTSVTVSGATTFLSPVYQNSVAAANRYVTSGELTAAGGGDAYRGQDNFWTGAANVFSPTTTVTISGITRFGSAGQSQVSAAGDITASGAGGVAIYGPLGMRSSWGSVARIASTQMVSYLSGPSVTVTGLIAAGSIGLGLTATVVSGMESVNSWNVGVPIDVEVFGSALPSGLGTQLTLKNANYPFAPVYQTAQNVIVTASGNTFAFTGGAIRLVSWALNLTAPNTT